MHINPIGFYRHNTNFKSVLPIKKVIAQLPNGTTEEIFNSTIIANLTQALVGRINKLGKEAGIIQDAVPNLNLTQKAGSTFIGADNEIKRFLLFGEDAKQAAIYGKRCYGSEDISEGMRQTNIEAEIIAPLSKRITNSDGDTLSLTLFAKKKGTKYILDNIEVVNDKTSNIASKIEKSNNIDVPPTEQNAYQPELFEFKESGLHPSQIDEYRSMLKPAKK